MHALVKLSKAPLLPFDLNIHQAPWPIAISMGEKIFDVLKVSCLVGRAQQRKQLDDSETFLTSALLLKKDSLEESESSDLYPDVSREI